MDFEWDDAKAASNLRKHGVSFTAAVHVFDDPVRIEWFDDREDYGEERYCTIAEVQGVILFVVYTMRGDRTRIISARRASREERDGYHGDSTA